MPASASCDSIFQRHFTHKRWEAYSRISLFLTRYLTVEHWVQTLMETSCVYLKWLFFLMNEAGTQRADSSVSIDFLSQHVSCAQIYSQLLADQDYGSFSAEQKIKSCNPSPLHIKRRLWIPSVRKGSNKHLQHRSLLPPLLPRIRLQHFAWIRKFAAPAAAQPTLKGQIWRTTARI